MSEENPSGNIRNNDNKPKRLNSVFHRFDNLWGLRHHEGDDNDRADKDAKGSGC